MTDHWKLRTLKNQTPLNQMGKHF